MKVFHGFMALCLAGLFFFLLSCNNENDSGPYYHPADFEPSASTCFIWSTDFYEIIPELAGIISTRDKVTLYIGKDDDLKTVHSILEKYGGNLKNIHFVKLDNKPQNAWIRDYGPVYLINDQGKKKLVNFFYYRKRQTFNENFAVKMKLPIIQSSLSSTGGAREVNGKGTIILCEAHELAENRPKTKREIEQEIIKNLQLKKVIWLKRGIPQDDSELTGPLFERIYPNGVNGHVDEFCRFADPNTILISSVSESEAKKHPILAEAKKRLDENYEILRNSTDQDGNKFNVIKVPYAPLIIEPSPRNPKRLVASVTSYMNFIVTNSLIILPSYISDSGEPGMEEVIAKENRVEEIFRKVFPLKEIIKVNAADLNRFSGGFHCISINEPLVKK